VRLFLYLLLNILRYRSSFINRLFIPAQISINNIELKARVANDSGLTLNYANYYNDHLNSIVRIRRGDVITTESLASNGEEKVKSLESG